MISDYEFEDVQTKLTRLRQEFDELSIKYQEHAPNRSLNPAFPHGQPMFAFREIHGPLRQDIDNAHTVTFFVDYDTFISKLYNAKLKIRFHNVRANVTAAAGGGGGTTASAGGGGTTVSSTNGGGQTTSNGGAQTSSDGGAQTSSQGGGQTSSGSAGDSFGGKTNTTVNTGAPNPVSTQQESGADPHTHSMNNHVHAIDVSRLTSSGGDRLMVFSDGGTAAFGYPVHVHTIVDHGHTVANHNHSVGNHNHTVSDHQHNVTPTAHTHDVVLNSHSHGLTYGIFEQAYSNPGLSISINGIDRTAALGGPWNTNPGTLDITQYLRETSDDPIRGEIPIVFSVASSLLNIEVTLKSMVFSADLLQAGGV